MIPNNGNGKRVRSAKEITKCMDCGKTVPKNYALKGKPQRCQKCRKAFELLNPEHNPKFKTGKYKDSEGYICVIARQHPNCREDGRMLEHRLVMEKKLGRLLKPNEIVHHIDGRRDNNVPSNLIVCQSFKEHISHHMLPPCVICGAPHSGRGFCASHHSKWGYRGYPAKGLFEKGKWFAPHKRVGRGRFSKKSH